MQTRKNKEIFSNLKGGKSKGRKSKGKKSRGGKTKKRIGIKIEKKGLFTNEQDCLMKLRESSNKGGKCSLIGVGSYELQKEVPIYK